MATHWLSKSKILSGLQCPKRLYLEVHHPELAVVSDDVEYRFAVGHEVNEIARALQPGGILIEDSGDLRKALHDTKAALRASSETTLFEATFEYRGVLIKADIFTTSSRSRRLVEVKSSASIKNYYSSDVAVQYWVLQGAGYQPDKVELAHIDTSFVYPGDADYRGIFKREDLTKEACELKDDVPRCVKKFQKVLAGDTPEVDIGDHCSKPFACPFYDHCTTGMKTTEYPVTLLPRGGLVASGLLAEGFEDLRDVPADRLRNPIYQKIWRITVNGKPELDPMAAQALSQYSYPRYYLDFETIAFAVPIWQGTRPYQQIPFQWSCHIERKAGSVEQEQFLDTSGELPVRRLAESLLAAVGTSGPIFVYGNFEGLRLDDLCIMLPDLAPKLQMVRKRLVDLLPLARKVYYHPEMKGSWSIKALLPTIAPELAYGDLEVQDGDMAQQAYFEAINPETMPQRHEAIRKSLLEYCGQDTKGLVSIVKFFEKA